MNRRNQQTIIIVGIVVIAVIAATVLILFSGNTTASGIDFSKLSPTRRDDGGFVIGDAKAPVTIVEFADFACPHCAEYKPTIDQFIKDYVATGKARYEYRTFPTAGGQMTAFAGQIAECIDDQKPGSFWNAAELFYQLASKGQYGQDIGRIAAQQTGVDYAKVLDCQRNAQQVQKDIDVGTALGVSGTPAVAVRYGDDRLQWISLGGQTYNQGGVPAQVLQQVVAQSG
jgi:protein-disulfide isomerase